MIFLGSRGSTSWQINELLKMDEMLSFNPHALYNSTLENLIKNKSQMTCASTKHLFVSNDKNPLINFYKMRVSYFYGADIERLNFQNIKRRVFNRINQAVSYQTNEIVDNLVTAKDIRKLDIDSPLA